ncbi:MAG: hypothetical protein FWC21_02520, partial [Treponema sp.]|nr:hypothetical protein [Treponema sp.]
MKRVIKNLLKFLFLPFYNRYRLVINKLDGINDRFDDINVTQKDNESLQQENNTLNECLYKTNIEKEMLNKQLTYKTYLLDRFDELHEDVVQSSW